MSDRLSHDLSITGVKSFPNCCATKLRALIQHSSAFFLDIPMQRILRVPPMMESIIKNKTPVLDSMSYTILCIFANRKKTSSRVPLRGGWCATGTYMQHLLGGISGYSEAGRLLWSIPPKIPVVPIAPNTYNMLIQLTGE
jgi:hypothetical protein